MRKPKLINIAYIVLFIFVIIMVVRMPSRNEMINLIGNQTITIIDKYYSKDGGITQLKKVEEGDEDVDTFMVMYDDKNAVTFTVINSSYFDRLKQGDKINMTREIIIDLDTGEEFVQYCFVED